METKVVAIKQSKEIKYLNETLKVIYERRSVRKFKDVPVETTVIEQIINAGRMAPSALNKQPWRFYVLTNKEGIKAFSKGITKAVVKDVVKSRIREIMRVGRDFLHFSHGPDYFKEEDPIFHSAPVVIFISSPKDNEWAALDVGMCSQNMMLAARSLGLDTCVVGMGKFVEQTTNYVKLHVPETEHVNLAIVLGYSAEAPESKGRVKNNVTYL